MKAGKGDGDDVVEEERNAGGGTRCWTGSWARGARLGSRKAGATSGNHVPLPRDEVHRLAQPLGLWAAAGARTSSWRSCARTLLQQR